MIRTADCQRCDNKGHGRNKGTADDDYGDGVLGCRHCGEVNDCFVRCDTCQAWDTCDAEFGLAIIDGRVQCGDCAGTCCGCGEMSEVNDERGHYEYPLSLGLCRACVESGRYEYGVDMSGDPGWFGTGAWSFQAKSATTLRGSI